MMDKGRCSSTAAAVTPQRPWKRIISGLILPKPSSGEKIRCHSLSARRDRRYHSQEEEEEEEEERGEGSSGEEGCNDVPFKIIERLRCIGCNKRRPSFSDTESVLDIVKMPVGTTNSILKSSFSLTSLRSSTPTDSPEHSAPLKLRTERLYHSLTKKSRTSSEQDKEQWRKSWGSGISQDGKEFWEGFQADYDYLMAQNMLERDVSEVSGPTEGIPRAPLAWSHSEFMDHFAQLYSWLKGIQDSVYGKQENVTDWNLRAERLEDMQRQRFRLDKFNEESKNVIARRPESEGEVLWLVKHINDKWETVESMMGGCRKGEGEKGTKDKLEHEIRCLRKWLRELDTKLEPLSLQNEWTKAELEAKAKEHMVLHRDIEAHRKIVSSLHKLCEKLKSPNFLEIARGLHDKYLHYYLRSLEWKYHIESLVGVQLNKNPTNVNNDSDGEPVAKIARFTSNQDLPRYEIDDSDAGDGLKSEEDFSKDDDQLMDTTDASYGKSLQLLLPDTMVGAKAERPDGSILGLGGSASILGTKSKNANILFSCANNGTESRSKSVEESVNGGVNGHLRDINTATEPEINRTPQRPPNTAMFTCEHLDTESEQEKQMSDEDLKNKKLPKESFEAKDVETTSSDDNWTYTTSEQVQNVEPKPETCSENAEFNAEKQIKYFSAKNIPSMLKEDSISSTYRKFIDRADKMVRPKFKSWKTRRQRIKKGMKEKRGNSCDAGGECTSDNYASDDSCTSDGSCSSDSSLEGVAEGRNKTFEEILKGQRNAMRFRPWSMSSVSCLRTPRGQSWKSRTSVSESALNQMMNQERYYSTPGKGYRTIGEDDGSGGFSRRRRTKMRRRMSKKSESGLVDAMTLSESDKSSPGKQPSNLSGLVNSGSFSGLTRKQRDACDMDSVTGTETDDDANRLAAPVFRLGPSDGAVTVTEQDKGQVEEQLSLNWDNYYQEKYQSEINSEEPIESDTAKRFLEFGDDYGKFLGNQSDCASSSDVDEVRQTLRQSREQLDAWEMKFNKTIGGSIPVGDAVDDYACKTFLNEIIGACKRNVDCLNKLLDEVKDELLLAKEHNYILNVKESWEKLKSTAELHKAKQLDKAKQLHKAKQLQKDMTVLKDELLALAAQVENKETTVTSREELEAKITQIQNELNLMQKGKNRLLQANVSVHMFLATHSHSEPGLKEEVTELYQVWEQTFSRVSRQLAHLQSLAQMWHDFEDHLAQLQCVLRTDTLKVLDFALKCGSPSADARFSLQDIVGILTDKESSSKNSLTVTDGPEKGSTPALTALNTEGSLSDSGISDSGSERELSEREKRLAQLKRLAKRLESILAPGSQVLSNMFQRIEQAEAELRELQKTCRDLIVRSASTEEIRMIVEQAPALGSLELETSAPPASKPAATGKKMKAALPLKVEGVSAGESSGAANAAQGEIEGGKPKKFWFWRLLRYSLPFQLALIALLCLASVMEPRCCDSLNNLDLSLNPQLRYNSGPPPV